MSDYKTSQESFWAGAFGDDYAERNRGAQWVASNLALFAKILARTEGIQSVIEYGSNIGLNLQALRQLLPGASQAGIEINEKAANILEANGVRTIRQSILEYVSEERFDLVLIKGVLIHINPESLQKVYQSLYESSARYICLAEYYNPTAVAISYRGHADKLFKRDFAGELLAQYTDLKLLDYGFAYHGDPNFPQDDITWFLLEKPRVIRAP